MINPDMHDLFSQLGLANSDEAIDKFIAEHKGLSQRVHIEDAPFWNPSQANFLQGALQQDAEWAELIDQLDSRLR